MICQRTFVILLAPYGAGEVMRPNLFVDFSTISVILCISYLIRKQQNFTWLSSCRYCMDCAQNLPGTAPDSVLRVLQISLLF